MRRVRGEAAVRDPHGRAIECRQVCPRGEQEHPVGSLAVVANQEAFAVERGVDVRDSQGSHGREHAVSACGPRFPIPPDERTWESNTKYGFGQTWENACKTSRSQKGVSDPKDRPAARLAADADFR